MYLTKLELNRPGNLPALLWTRHLPLEGREGRGGTWQSCLSYLVQLNITGRDRELKCPKDSQSLALASLPRTQSQHHTAGQDGPSHITGSCPLPSLTWLEGKHPRRHLSVLWSRMLAPTLLRAGQCWRSVLLQSVRDYFSEHFPEESVQPVGSFRGKHLKEIDIPVDLPEKSRQSRKTAQRTK